MGWQVDGSGQGECPDLVSVPLSLVVALGVAGLLLFFAGTNLTNASVMGSIAFGCFCGTFTFALLTPSQRWQTGALIGGILSVMACGLTLMLVMFSGNVFAVVTVGVMAVATGAGSFAGLALAPPQDTREVRLALLAIAVAVAAVLFCPTYYSTW